MDVLMRWILCGSVQDRRAGELLAARAVLLADGREELTKPITRRSVPAGLSTLTAAGAVAPASAVPAPAAGQPLPIPPPRIPRLDMGVEQQPDERIRWLQDAKLGMFIHWGVYSGPARGEWYMENAAIPPEDYRRYLTDATTEQFTASAYNPGGWARLATDMGARYTVLTARHHDGSRCDQARIRVPGMPDSPRWSAISSANT
jgi:hypothetical protein